MSLRLVSYESEAGKTRKGFLCCFMQFFIQQQISHCNQGICVGEIASSSAQKVLIYLEGLEGAFCSVSCSLELIKYENGDFFVIQPDAMIVPILCFKPFTRLGLEVESCYAYDVLTEQEKLHRDEIIQ